MRLVEGRADEIVHRRVDDDEGLGLARLHIEHARDQNPGIADQQATGLEDQCAVEIARGTLDHRGVVVGMRRLVDVVAIGNAETAAEIDVLDHVAVGAKRANEIGQQRERVVERRQFGDLAADMHIDAGDAHALERGGVRRRPRARG